MFSESVDLRQACKNINRTNEEDGTMRDLRSLLGRCDGDCLAREAFGLAVLSGGILFWLFMPGPL
jgi:hypothetical protein